MRLYLSSSRMSDRFDDLIGLVAPSARVAVISNALDFMPGPARAIYVRHVLNPIDRFRRYGLDATHLDLRAYFGRPAELEAKLAEVGLIWATGGNSFLLRRAMRQSGLDELLQRRLADDSLTYAGWSAGAVVAGSTLRGLELMDQPRRKVAGYASAPIWEALGLLPYVIVPHFASDRLESSAAARCARALESQGVPHLTLRDGEAIVVNGGGEDWVRPERRERVDAPLQAVRN